MRGSYTPAMPMFHLWPLIQPLLSSAHAKITVEIGAWEGENTRNLLQFARKTGGMVHVIDPYPVFDVGEMEREYGPYIIMHKKKSVDALPTVFPCDAVLIDGDHTWYTVINELRLIHKHGTACAHMPLILLHDVGWPNGRRDSYYTPEEIPEEYRHPYTRKGLFMGHRFVSDVPWAINSEYMNAIYEGGPRNGILTAIEDFLVEVGTPEWSYSEVPGFYGLGILLHERTARRKPALVDTVKSMEVSLPIREHLETLERNRMSCYIEMFKLRWKLKYGSFPSVDASSQNAVTSGTESASVSRESSGSVS